jgi:hypothetical protein
MFLSQIILQKMPGKRKKLLGHIKIFRIKTFQIFLQISESQ